MARQLINIGTIENDGTGDKLRDAMDKINDNFSEVYTELGGDSLSNLDLSGNTISSANSNGNIILDPNGTGLVKIDNLALTGNTISSTDTNGNITLDPDGTGSVVIDSPVSITGALTLSTALSANVTGDLTGDVTGTVSSISNHDTDNLSEGSSNLYHTDARSRASLSATGSINYDNSTGVISFTDAVTSVNGNTGAVVLSLSDIGVDGQLDGDLVGSVFGNDSTILVDGGANEVVGTINSTSGTITTLNATTIQGFTSLSGAGDAIITGGVFYGDETQVDRYLMKDSSIVIDETGTLLATINNSTTATFSGTVNLNGATVTNAAFDLTGDTTGTHYGFVDGDLIGSVFGDDSTLIIDGINKTGTLTELDVDDINIDGNTISAAGSPTNQNLILNVKGIAALQTNADTFILQPRTDYGVNGVGLAGDADNFISQDDDYLYKAAADYDGSTLIWKRAKLRYFDEPLFYVGADDSTMRGIGDLEGIKIIGGTNVTTSSDAEGNITIDATGSGGISNVVEDTTPQLGGDLDINGFNITSARSNENINIIPAGTGSVVLDGDVTITGTLSGGSPLTLGNSVDFDSNDITSLGTINTHTVPGGTGTLALTSDITTSNLTGTVLNIGADDSTLRAVGVGEGIKIIGGTNVTTTSDAEGNITIDASDTGISNIVEDTTPQLGGNLDLNSNNITGTGDISITGGATITSADAGSTAGPDFVLYRNSSSPADGDYIGQLQFKGRHDGGGDEIYAKVTGKISDATQGTEDGLIETAIKGNGSFTIVSRQNSNELQLLNSVGLSVAGNTTLSGTLNGHTIPGGSGTLALTSDITFTASSSDTLTNKSIALGSNTVTGTVLNIGADDSTLRAVGVGEGIKIIGGTNVTTTSDAEGNITVNSSATGNVVDDTTPQLGGDLDVNGFKITTARSNEDLQLEPNGTGTVTILGGLKLEEGTQEKFSSLTSATGTVTHDCSNGTIFYHTSISADFTANFTNLQLESAYATTVSLVLVQGASEFIPTAVQIGGASQTINWQGGIEPTGTDNGIDVVSFTILNNSGTYTVLAQLVDFT